MAGGAMGEMMDDPRADRRADPRHPAGYYRGPRDPAVAAAEPRPRRDVDLLKVKLLAESEQPVLEPEMKRMIRKNPWIATLGAAAVGVLLVSSPAARKTALGLALPMLRKLMR